MKALTIAATGMNAQQLNLEVIANNIANINTTGFKRARAEFSDLLYQSERTAGVPNQANQSIVPEGALVGLGVQTAAVRNLHIQGSFNQTGNPYDVALTGRGWFQIQSPTGETLYTRAGAFNKNPDGQLVTLDGNPVEPAITIPPDAIEVTITDTGRFSRNCRTRSIRSISASSPLRTSPMKRVWRRSAVISTAKPKHPAAHWSAFRAIPATARSSKAISKRRMSIR